MAQSRIYEGTPDQIVKHLKDLPRTQRIRVTVVSDEPCPRERNHKMIAFGMFPELKALTEDDFKSAEWRGEDVNV